MRYIHWLGFASDAKLVMSSYSGPRMYVQWDKMHAATGDSCMVRGVHLSVSDMRLTICGKGPFEVLPS